MSLYSLNSSSRLGYKNDLGLSKRPKIFEEWPKKQRPEQRDIYQSPSQGIQKLQQSREAEQVLEKSLLVMNNMNEYLKIKETHIASIQDYSNKSDKMLTQINKLSTERGAQYRKQQLQRQLIQFNNLIRKGSQLQKKLQFFKLTNLANYDATNTSIQYTRSYEQSHQKLIKWLDQFRMKRLRLQQSLVCYEKKVPQNKILGDQNNFKQCLRDVKEQMDLSHMANIHMLMLFQIQKTAETVNVHLERVKSDRRNYAFYESVYDSMTLMQNQSKQMNKDRKWFKKKYTQLTFDNATEIIPQTEDSYPLFAQNLKIYESNEILLARYNAQINLREYGERRKNFVKETEKYKTYFNAWKDQRQYANELYSHHCKLINYQKKINLQEKVIGLQLQKKEIHDAYDKCLSLKIPSEMGVLQKYKFRLADQIQKTIKNGGIIVPWRPQIPSPQKKNAYERQRQEEKLKNFLKEGNLMQKYIEFFIKIKYKPENSNLDVKKNVPDLANNLKSHRPRQQKLQYLRQYSQTAKSLYFQINQQFNKNSTNEESQKYRVGLQYVLQINKYLMQTQKINDNDDVQVSSIKRRQRFINQYFQAVKGKRWQALPIGLQTVLFNFSTDLIQQKNALLFLNSYHEEMVKMSRSLAKDIDDIWSDDKKMISFENSLADKIFKIEASERLLFYQKYYRKISIYSPQIKQALLGQLWKINEKMVLQTFRPYWERKKIKNVQKSQFFTCRVLSYLADSLEGKSIKIPNISSLVLFYLNTVERFEYNNWNQGHIFLQIIKQRLLIKYMKQTLSTFKDFNLKTEMQVMKNVLTYFYLIYEMRDCVSLVDTQNFEQILKHGLLIQEQIIGFRPKFTSESKKQMQQQCIKVIQKIKKTPFVLGTSYQISDFIGLIHFEEKHQILNRLLHNVKTMGNKSQFQILSQLYSECQKINKIEHSTLIIQFPPSDVVTIRDKSKKSIYLEALANKVRKQLKGCNHEIEAMLKIYRGHTNEIKKSDGGEYEEQSELHGVLHQMRNSLQRLV